MNGIKAIGKSDFERFFSIWKQGLADAVSYEMATAASDEDRYRSAFEKHFEQLIDPFAIWGYYDGGELQAWVSLLPCQAGVIMEQNFGQISLYVDNLYKTKGIGKLLVEYAVEQARQRTCLWYILAYISEQNIPVQRIVTSQGFTKVGVLPNATQNTLVPTLGYWVLGL